MESNKTPILFTNKARCRDCYRCIRGCPVKAIRMKNGQAQVDDSRCILCGKCMRECPQQAKSYRPDLSTVKEWIANGEIVAASIAPSFPAVFEEWEAPRIPSALRKLGFEHVSETSVGAYECANLSREYVEDNQGKSALASACPASVQYVEKYAPDKTSFLIPVQSPMLLHAQIIKARMGENSKVVFIGPCLAKKREAENPLHSGVDAVLTFEELTEWFENDGIILSNLEESRFDMPANLVSRLFPLKGGMLKTADIIDNGFDQNVFSTSGAAEFQEVIDVIDNSEMNAIIEPLYCENGCINGPLMDHSIPLFERRNRLLKYYQKQSRFSEDDYEHTPVKFSRRQFNPGKIQNVNHITEKDIEKVLAQIGKVSKEDQLDCGACGYSSCREKAIAVLNDMAEAEMCIPHMRYLAEQRSDNIIEFTPNGIVLLDLNFNIFHMNPAFRKMFYCGDAQIGKPISILMDAEPFEQFASLNKEMIDLQVEHRKYNIICHQIIYQLKPVKQYVGIFVNITKNLEDRKSLDTLRLEITKKAQELLEHQVDMAQNMARALGENTARGEELVDKMLKLSGSQASNTRDEF